MNSSKNAAWANNNFKTAESKLGRGECSVKYVERAEEIKLDAEFSAHYDSKEGRKYRAQQKAK